MKELTESSRDHLLKNLRGVNEKAPAFLATSGKSPQANGMTLIGQGVEKICIASRGRRIEGVIKQCLEVCPVEGKTNCLTTIEKDNLIMETSLKQLNPSTESNGREPYQQNRVYDISHKSPTLCARPTGDYSRIGDEQRPTERIRRLTPTECARLQTVPEWYKWQCSNAQQYKMLGNGWTVEVIKHIFSFINIDKAEADKQVKEAIESGLY